MAIVSPKCVGLQSTKGGERDRRFLRRRQQALDRIALRLRRERAGR